MKFKAIISSIFPHLSVVVSLLILPIILLIYFAVTQYSDRFITEQNINYYEVQNNWLGQLFLDQKWIGWFNRFMDFAIWGLLAVIVLVAIWMFSVAKVSIKNHYTEEGFTNFHESKVSWHSHFFTVAVLKVCLVLAIIISVFSIIGKIIPQLSVHISIALQEFKWVTAKDVFVSCLYIVLLQFLIATCIKTFKHLQA